MDLSKMEMKIYKLKDLLNRVSNPVEIENSTLYTQIGIRSHAKGVFIKEPVTGLSLGNKRVFWIEPDCLIVNIVFAWERAIAKTTSELEGYIVSHRFPMYKTNEKADLDYLLHYLSTLRGKKILEDASPGGAGRNKTLSQKDFLESKIKLPSFKVQKYISGFLKLLDKKIQLQQQKIDLLQEQKKGFLQKMFPKAGETQPEMRFDGFTENWKECKLGDVSNIIGGGTPSTSIEEYWNGNINWYSPVEIGEEIYVYESRKKITEAGLKKSSARILPIGTVLFTSRAGIGNTAILAREGCTNQGFQSIVPLKEKLDSYFIFSRTEELKRYAEINGAGSTFVEISGKQMSKMPILLPDLKEQKKIGLFFKRLDDEIILQKTKLNFIQQQKQGFMQQMFI